MSTVERFALFALALSVGAVVLGLVARVGATRRKEGAGWAGVVVSAVGLFVISVVILMLVATIQRGAANADVSGSQLQVRLGQLESAEQSLKLRLTKIESVAERERSQIRVRIDRSMVRGSARDRIVYDLAVENTRLRLYVARHGDPQTQMENYLGRYTSGFEESAFVPCGDDKAWWVEFYPDVAARERISHLTDSPSNPAGVVQFTGVLSIRGRFGHMGGYERLFLVVDAAVPEEGSKCP